MYAIITSYGWAMPAAFFAGLGDNWIIMALCSLLMERTKPGMLGRVTALQDTASALTTGLSLIVVGLLKNVASPWQLLLISGLLLCLTGVSAALALRGPCLLHPS